MPTIRLCFLWHMHQPLYKELATGQYRLPWVRLHALKDYFGMVKILDEFPAIHQTFNLAPSLVMQLEDYAAGTAKDPFLDAALKPAEHLNRTEREFILTYFFQANHERVIRRYPRYAELFDLLGRFDRNPHRAAEAFEPAAIRDLQVLSQLAWFDEQDLADAPLAALSAKGRDFTLADQQLIGETESAALRRVLDAYREAAARGQIELSASPLYHPILPLLCDTNIAHAAHPYVSLPPQFSYPQDALEQLVRSREFFREKFGVEPEGMWPSEGAVSEAAIALAAQAGFTWTAADNEILARSLGIDSPGDATYRPYRWEKGALSAITPAAINIVFRDRRLSDLIALAYPQMSPSDASKHFIAEVRKSCADILKAGHDALVPVILDGENAWENYAQNGRPFLKALYASISEAPGITAVSIGEGIRHTPAAPLSNLFPGSWIDANFDIWIGGQEDNLAWERLLAARKTYDALAQTVSPQAKAAAFEELLIAEGSDWCWWYGPENVTANQSEFDQLYRDHLANMYRLLGQEPPAELEVPIARGALKPQHEPPSGLIQPRIDGTRTSGREWENAGQYSPDPRITTLHGQRALLQGLWYGSDGNNIYVRADLADPVTDQSTMEFVLRLRTTTGSFEVRTQTQAGQIETDLPAGSVHVAAFEIYEARISMAALHVRLGDPIYVRLEALRDGLPLASIPHDGELQMHSGSFAAYAY